MSGAELVPTRAELAELVRVAVDTAGCGCCQDYRKHGPTLEKIAEALGVEPKAVGIDVEPCSTCGGSGSDEPVTDGECWDCYGLGKVYS